MVVAASDGWDVSGTPLFAFEGVAVDAPEGSVLEGIDARLPAEGITAITGPSGSGKSTLLRLCNRLAVPSRGRVLFRGEDLSALDPLIHRRRVGMVFQQPTPFGGTVRDNLLVAAPQATEASMGNALARAHLSAGFLDRRASELSGGESQRVCLARALMVGPQVLLMDEPTSALDDEASRALEHLALALAAEGIPVLWVTHDLDQAERLATWTLALEGGHVRAWGRPRRTGAPMPAGDVGALGVVASLALVGVAVALSVAGRLGLGRSLVWASARALVQLLLVGVALTVVIDPDRPLVLSWLWIAAMLVFCADVVRRRAREVPGLFGLALVAFGLTVAVALGIVFGLHIFPLEGTHAGSDRGARHRQLHECGDRRGAAPDRGPSRSAPRGGGAPRSRTALAPRARAPTCAGPFGRR